MVFPFECPVCGHKTNMPKTNADRIRSMSDEELAQMLTDGKGTFSCFKCLEFGDGECSMKCDERFLEWLQQPAEEADNETVGERKEGND